MSTKSNLFLISIILTVSILVVTLVITHFEVSITTSTVGLNVNFAFPWAYISVGNALSFNDYKKADSSVNSSIIRSDVTHTFDIMATKAIGDFFPVIDQNRNLFINLSYEKVISEANTLNYDYIADSFSMSLTKSF